MSNTSLPNHPPGFRTERGDPSVKVTVIDTRIEEVVSKWVPRAYTDIAKGAKDLLYGSAGSGGIFQFENKVTFQSKTANGVTLATTAVRRGDGMSANCVVAGAKGNLTGDAVITSSGAVELEAAALNLAPGLTVSATASLPALAASTVGLVYRTPYLVAKSSMSLSITPLIDLALSTGYREVTLGTQFGFNTASSLLTSWSFAAGYQDDKSETQAGAFLLDSGRTARFIVSRAIDARSSLGAELVLDNPLRTFNTESGDVVVATVPTAPPSFALGYARKLGGGAVAKVKVDNSGIVSALYEDSLLSGPRVTVSTQLDSKDLNKAPKVGLSFLVA